MQRREPEKMAQTRVKLKNAESSTALIQEQLVKTLEDLHQEIQKQCSRRIPVGE